MAKETRQPRDEQPNHASSIEQAEGSRENVQGGNAHQEAAGITNRSRKQEEEAQESLPPRGQGKGGSHA